MSAPRPGDGASVGTAADRARLPTDGAANHGAPFDPAGCGPGPRTPASPGLVRAIAAPDGPAERVPATPDQPGSLPSSATVEGPRAASEVSSATVEGPRAAGGDGSEGFRGARGDRIQPLRDALAERVEGDGRASGDGAGGLRDASSDGVEERSDAGAGGAANAGQDRGTAAAHAALASASARSKENGNGAESGNGNASRNGNASGNGNSAESGSSVVPAETIWDLRRSPRPAARSARARRSDGGGLARNAGSLVGSRLVVAVLGWAGTVLIARRLGEASFGQFTLVFSILGMLAIVTDMGIGRIAINGLLDPARDAGAFAGTYTLLRFALGLLGYAIALGVVVVGNYPSAVVRATALAGLVVVLATPSHAYDLVFQANLRMSTVALATVIGQAAQLALTIVIALRWPSVVWLVVPAVVCEVVILAVKVPKARRAVAFRYRVELRTWLALLREAVPLSIGTALAIVYYRVDSVMLSKLDTFDAVGLYGIAYKFVDLLHYVPVSLSVPLLTVLVRAWPDDLGTFRHTIVRGASFLVHTVALVLAEAWLFGGPAIGLLYGDDYRAAAGPTRALLVAEGLGTLSVLAFACLVAMGRHRRYPLITLAGLVVNVGLNAVLIPRYSYRGAAFATLATEVLVVALMWSLLLSSPGVRPLPVGFLLRVVPAIGVAGAVGYGTARFVPWPVAAVIVAVAYVGCAEWFRSPGPAGWRSLLSDGPPRAKRRRPKRSWP